MTDAATLAEIAQQYPGVTIGESAWGCAECDRLYVAWASVPVQALEYCEHSTGEIVRIIITPGDRYRYDAARAAYYDHTNQCPTRRAWRRAIGG